MDELLFRTDNLMLKMIEREIEAGSEKGIFSVMD